MTRKMCRTLCALCMAAGGLTLGSAAADDAVKVAAETPKVLLENPQVRVLDVRVPVGGKTPQHTHATPYLIYCLSDGKARFTSEDGKSAEVSFRAGDVVWREAETHTVENLAPTELHVLHVEVPSLGGVREHITLKPDDLHWQAGPPALPAGAQTTLLEGDPTKAGPFTVRLKTPAGYQIPAHWHPADEHVTVLSGTIYMGMGDKLDKAGGKALPAGSFAVMPAKMHHYAWTDEETVLQLHGMGPWGIRYVNPADNPDKRARD